MREKDEEKIQFKRKLYFHRRRLRRSPYTLPPSHYTTSSIPFALSPQWVLAYLRKTRKYCSYYYNEYYYDYVYYYYHYFKYLMTIIITIEIRDGEMAKDFKNWLKINENISITLNYADEDI